MSSDLIAAFDPNYKPPTQSLSNSTSAFPAPTSTSSPFGFYESPNPSPTPDASFQGPPPPAQTWWPVAGSKVDDILGTAGSPISPQARRESQARRQSQARRPLQARRPSRMYDDRVVGGLHRMSLQINVNNVQEEAYDPWVGFESAPSPPRSSRSPDTSRYSSPVPRHGRERKPTLARANTDDLFNFSIADLAASAEKAETGGASRNTSAGPSKLSQPYNPGAEVLFDADEEANAGEDDDDEFGDFETVAEPAPAPIQDNNGMSLLDLMDDPPAPTPKHKQGSIAMLSPTSLPYPEAPKSPSFQERTPFADLAIDLKPLKAVKKEEEPKSESPITAWPSFVPSKPKIEQYQDLPAPPPEPEDDGWGDFADLPPETPDPLSAAPPKSDLAPGSWGPDKSFSSAAKDDPAWAWDAMDNVSSSSRQNSSAQQQMRNPSPSASLPPPTNVPPPSILLALFQQLFDLPQSTLFRSLATQPFSMKNRILSDPSTLTFLHGYLLLATVAGRIIAGRKQRWKRDTRLAQSMAIGPAAAGGKSGMKLAGVDKAEVVREEREAAEVVRIWKEQLGRLRSAVAAANSANSQSEGTAKVEVLVVPDISETMLVKANEGLWAAKACVICGLRRDERVRGLDANVEDSFGEWWVEFWGHRACKNFWVEHEGKLKSR